jgi:hypothetical protein
LDKIEARGVAFTSFPYVMYLGLALFGWRRAMEENQEIRK